MIKSSLLDAIRVVKENERVASASYADAAKRINNKVGKQLFEELSAFENFHYQQIEALEISLEGSGKYINYQGKEFPLPPIFEISATKEQNTKTVMAIITGALDLEKMSEKAYNDLSVQIDDKQGHEMFARLAEEEHKHYRILLDAFWTLTNLGNWSWSNK